MSIANISDNELRLIGEAKVLRDLLSQALTVMADLEGESATEGVMLAVLRHEMHQALHPNKIEKLL